MNEATSGFDPVDDLVDGFLERYRRGERPSLSEYTDKHPELAERIRAIFPALLVMEEIGSGDGQSRGSRADGTGAATKVPERLGDYLLLRRIGSGGMGVVYEAIQESLGRHVALKTLPFHQLGDSTRLERFRREARAAARLHHTHIVPVFGVGEHEGLHYYIMQFIRGQGLDNVLRDVKRLRQAPEGKAAPDDAGARGMSATLALGLSTGQFQHNGARLPKPVDPEGTDADVAAGHRSELTNQPEAQYFRSVARIGTQVADALEYAHQQGILHRDIKPSNLLLDAHGEVWVTDFGLAKDQGSDELTMSGEIVGTLLYMAPERFHGECDQRSDVYGLGVTLYELVSLRPPYEAADRHTLMQRVLSEAPSRLKHLAPTVPHDLETIVEKAIAREPSHRYATAAALGDDLQRFLDDKPIRARRATKGERFVRWCRRNPWVAALLSAVAFFLVLIAVVSSTMAIRLNRERDRTRAAYLENRRTLYAAQIHLAHRAWEDAEIARAQEILSTAPCIRGGLDEPDLRGWEWHYLSRLCRRDALTLKDSDTNLFTLAWAPNERWLASGGWDGNIRLWDLTSDNHTCVILSGHFNEVHQVVFSPDGRTLASAARDGTARLWDIESGREVHSLGLSNELVRSVAFSPDGRRIAAAGGDGLIYQWNRPDYQPLPTIAAHDAQILSITYSADSRRLASCGTDRTAKVWDVESDRLLQTFAGHIAQVSGLAFSPDGLTLATSSEDRTIRLWNAHTGETKAILSGHGNWVYSVAFSPDGRSIASVGDDSTVRIWDVETHAERRRFRGHVGHVRGVAFDASGRYVASSNNHGTVKIWDLAGGAQESRSFRGHRAVVGRVAFSPDGQTLASGSWDSQIRLWNVASGQSSGPLLGHQGNVERTSYSPDGLRLASGGTDGTIRLWSLANGRELATMKGHTGSVTSVAFHPDGRHLASAGADGSVRIWSALGQPVKALLDHAAPFRAVVYSPDGRRLVSISEDRKVRIWQTDDDRKAPIVVSTTAVQTSVCLSRDSKSIALGGLDGGVSLRRAESGQLDWAIHGHENYVSGLAFSPDGSRIVTAGWDHRIKLWDTANGRETLSLKNEGGFYDVAFDPSGTRIAAAGNGYAIELFETDQLGEPPLARLVLGESHRPSDRSSEKPRMPAPLRDLADRDDPAARIFEGEALVTLTRPNGQVGTQSNMRDFGPQWSKGKQLIWERARKGDVLKLILPAPSDGVYEVSAAFTTAPDFGVVSMSVEEKHVKGPLDLYSPKVIHTGELSCGPVKLRKGDNRLEITILSKNPKSSGNLFGLDWVKIIPVRSNGPQK